MFTEELEMELVEYFKELDSMFYELTRSEFFRLAYDLAQKNTITHPLNWDKNRSAGNEWLKGFNHRYSEIVLKKPEQTTIARARGLICHKLTVFTTFYGTKW
ncbi:hypothetical protein PR048_022095 [Dryococelus australis]|uniref:HTH CENPB-type domain-containing protein n=1 Tax=Dryococelus australis TaxID=614101 RepID=A0ABQ9H047_9NEOP|nr:hypothetical protein PR048_022095 [Dryococelus australis]